MATTVDEVLLTPAEEHDRPTGPAWLLRDSWTEALRHLRGVPRSPELLMFATIQPIMFIVLFVYVFGGAITAPGYDDYKQYLLPGIFAQTVLFNSSFTGVGLSAGSVEAANSAGFIWMFPLTFVSSAFVPPETMPGWLQPIANNNPFTIVTNATRALYNGRDPGSDLWVAWGWAIGITLVFAWLASRKFASSTSK